MPEIAIIMGSVIIMLLILGISINGIVSKVLDHRRSLLPSQSAQSGEDVRAIAERTAMIEDRLAVLERIATDRGQLLSDEIEQLRIANKDIAKDKEQAS